MQKVNNTNSILPTNLINQGKNENYVISGQSNSTAAVYKTNTLDQYGGINGGRNSILNNISGMVNSSVVGQSVNNGIVHHQRNNTQN